METKILSKTVTRFSSPFTSFSKLLRNNLIIVFFVSALLHSENAKGGHIFGAEISYECMSGDTFLITIGIYRNCAGVGWGSAVPSHMGTAAGKITITSPCDTIMPIFSLAPNECGRADGGCEVSQFCAGSLLSSNCNVGVGNTLPGIVLYEYQAVAILPACNNWTIEYTANCCRTTSQNLVGMPAGPTVIATLNNSAATCNNSPTFNSKPAPYVCAGQTVHYNIGGQEFDGDSLVFSSVAPLTINGVNATYSGPWSPTNPIANLSSFDIDAATGQFSFTPTSIGNWVFAIKIDEYRNGTLIGSVMRDFMFIVNVCGQAVPSAADSIQSLIGASLIGPRDVTVCQNSALSLEYEFTDSDNNDSLQLISNVNEVLPGANLNWYYPNAPMSYNTIKAVITWQAIQMPRDFNFFYIAAFDNSCPVYAFNYQVFTVNLSENANAGSDQSLCDQASSTSLQVEGGTSFQWYSVSGAPLVVGGLLGNIDCDTCQTVQVSPNTTTCYRVETNLSNLCKYDDTVCVSIVPPVLADIVQNQVICALDSNFQLQAVNPDGIWSALQFQQAVSSDGMVDAVQISANGIDVIHSIDKNGCYNADTLFIPITQAFSPSISSISTICTDAAPFALQSNVSGGIWRGVGIVDSILGIINPALLSPNGTYIITLDSSGICGGQDQISIQTFPRNFADLGYHENDIATSPFIAGNFHEFCGTNANLIYLMPEATANSNWNHSANWLTSSQDAFTPNTVQSGVYTSVFTNLDANGCTNRDTITIEILDTLISNAVLSLNTTPIQLTVDSSYASYIWYFNGAPISGLSTSTQSIEPAFVGKYKVLVSDACASGFTNEINVTVAGLNGIDDLQEFDVFPNPSNGIINISFLSNSFQGKQIEIFNVQGKRIYTSPIDNKSMRIDALSSGIYFIKIEGADTKKVVITN